MQQVASFGLVKAAQRCEPDPGVAFTTFATPTILGELRRFCRDTRWAVHVPRGVQEHVQALLALLGVLADRWGEPGTDGVVISAAPTHDMIAMLVGVHRPTVTSALRTLQRDRRIRRRDRNRWLINTSCRHRETARPLAIAA